jgi:hypothetical protein
MVQYCCEVRQAKLHADAVVQGRPVSSNAQYMLPAIVSQRVPAQQAALELHVRVQRLAPPCAIGRQTSGEAQSPSAAQRSSSCLLIVPPLLLLDADDDDTVALDADADADAEDDEGPAPMPELELGPTPPVPGPVLDEVAPPLPAGPLVPGGTHWALALQE